MNWIQITDADSVPLREGREVALGNTSIALFNVGGRFLAIENRCPHKGGPLADGIIGGTTVTCPLHNQRVCLETGRVTKPCDENQTPVRTFDVKVENGIVMLAFDSAVRAA
jgi:nitrite reductase [NAD(P)H] small subunit